MPRGLIVIAACTGLCLGCATGPSAQGGEPDSGANSMSGVPAPLRAAAVKDAAQRAGKSPDAAEVVAAEAVTWSDGSLGCPAPGMQYTQALVPGYRIIVKVDGQHYEYHAGARGQPMFCPAERVVAPAPNDRV